MTDTCPVHWTSTFLVKERESLHSLLVCVVATLRLLGDGGGDSLENLRVWNCHVGKEQEYSVERKKAWEPGLDPSGMPPRQPLAPLFAAEESLIEKRIVRQCTAAFFPGTLPVQISETSKQAVPILLCLEISVRHLFPDEVYSLLLPMRLTDPGKNLNLSAMLRRLRVSMTLAIPYAISD